MFWCKRSDVFVLPLPFYNDNIKEFQRNIKEFRRLWLCRNYGLTESWRLWLCFAKTTRQRVWRKPACSLVVLQSAKHNTTPSFQNIPSILSLPSLPLYYVRQLLKIALQVICGIFLVETCRGASLQYFDLLQRAMRPQKKQKDFGKKRNVAIKRVKSNA